MDRAFVQFNDNGLAPGNKLKRLLKRLTVRTCSTRLGFYTFFLNKCFVTKYVKWNIQNPLPLSTASGSSRRVFGISMIFVKITDVKHY